MLIRYDYLQQTGAWYTLCIDGQQITKLNGRIKVSDYLTDNKDMYDKLYSLVLERLGE